MYRIREWNKHFETSRSRQVTVLRKVTIPNKDNGLALERILRHPQGATIFGMFVLLVELCSRQKAPRYGLLTDTGQPDGKALEAQDIADMYFMDKGQVKTCLDFLSDVSVGWLENVEAISVPTEKEFTQVLKKRRHDVTFSKPEGSESDVSDKNTPCFEKVTSRDKGERGTIGGEGGSEFVFKLELEEINRTNPKKDCKDKKEEKVNGNHKLSYETFARYYNYVYELNVSEKGATTAMRATNRWSDQRARKWVARCKEGLFRENNTEILRKAFASDFLTGRIQTRGREPFALSIDWIIKNNTNYVKILDGYYDNRPVKPGNKSLTEKNYDDGDI